MWQGNNTTKLKWLVTNDNLMDIALHFISNLGDILSQQSSILGDKSLNFAKPKGHNFFRVTKQEHSQLESLSLGWRKKLNNVKTPTVLEIVVCLLLKNAKTSALVSENLSSLLTMLQE